MLAIFSPLSSFIVAFALVFLSAAYGQCTSADAALWAGPMGPGFTRDIVKVSTHRQVVTELLKSSLTGNTQGPLRMLAKKFQKHLSQLRPECARCFSENVVCVYGKCRDKGCSVNPLGQACLRCAKEKCRTAFDDCSDLDDSNRPPNPDSNGQDKEPGEEPLVSHSVQGVLASIEVIVPAVAEEPQADPAVEVLSASLGSTRFSDAEEPETNEYPVLT